jgi:hypothetical protein
MSRKELLLVVLASFDRLNGSILWENALYCWTGLVILEYIDRQQCCYGR